MIEEVKQYAHFVENNESRTMDIRAAKHSRKRENSDFGTGVEH